MLTRAERIKYNGLFLQAYEKGKRISSENFYITFTKTREDCKDSLPLTGFVVSKKFAKRANIRNKYKRAMREVYRLFRLKSENIEPLKKIGLLVLTIKSKVDPDKKISVFNEYFDELNALFEKLLK
ncbi:MAG: ribonuclease P protein component [Candidatus Caenarcaniphilales bacterium]|nr:ribonuclease P protein component [Candidatus Caenarcaniphilales bacterium]